MKTNVVEYIRYLVPEDRAGVEEYPWRMMKNALLVCFDEEAETTTELGDVGPPEMSARLEVDAAPCRWRLSARRRP